MTSKTRIFIEKAGAGTLDMIALCAEAGLPTPEFRQDGGQFVQTLRRVAEQVTQPESLDARVLGMLKRQSLSKIEISRRLGQKEISGRLNQVIRQLLAEHLVEYTNLQADSRNTGLPRKGRHGWTGYIAQIKGRLDEEAAGIIKKIKGIL